MTRHINLLLTAMLSCLFLTACTAPIASQPQPTDVEPTILPLEPTAKVYQPSATPPTEASDDTLCTEMLDISPPPLPPSIEDDFFFSGGLVENCELPCWQGITVGRSGHQEIQDMFDDVFGFDGAIDFFACSPLDSMYPHPAGRIQGFYATGYQWEPDPSSLLRIVVWTDDDTNLLRGLTFGWVSSESFKVYLSPQRIIRELGKPSYWMLDIFSTERAGKGSLESLMIYENGIVFRHFGVIPIALKVNEAERIFEEANAEFCLDQEYSNVGRVYIFEPFDRGLENLTTVQAYHLQNLLTEEYVVPIQESLGTSIDEVASQALHQDNACFYVDMLKGLYREEK